MSERKDTEFPRSIKVSMFFSTAMRNFEVIMFFF